MSLSDINNCVNDICNIFIETASASLGTYKPSTGRKHNVSENKRKPWFTPDCHRARYIYRKKKRLLKSNRSDELSREVKLLEKNYKKIMNKSIQKHRKKVQKTMRNMKSTNPKDYWKILNEGKRSCQPAIPLEILFQHFKELNASDSENHYLDENADVNENIFSLFLNEKICKSEIEICIKNLKNNKSCGEDRVINEYIKATSDYMIPLYEKLFNIIFDTGHIPETWLIGNIKPIFKNKGSSMDPKNFRPITILSCFGKLFTSILNLRLSKYCDNFDVLNENQTGFRKGYSTLDNIFVLHILFDLLKSKKKKLFCALIDFQGAFDTVWRQGLWGKLILCNIKGKMYNIIQSLYHKVMCCI